MGKIYRRETLVASVGRGSDEGKWKRKRNVIMNFRVTEEERDLINRRIKLSGLPKQDFFIASCMHQSINVVGNIKTFDSIRKEMWEIEEHLRGIDFADEIETEKAESLRMILEILDSFYKSEK